MVNVRCLLFGVAKASASRIVNLTEPEFHIRPRAFSNGARRTGSRISLSVCASGSRGSPFSPTLLRMLKGANSPLLFGISFSGVGAPLKAPRKMRPKRSRASAAVNCPLSDLPMGALVKPPEPSLNIKENSVLE